MSVKSNDFLKKILSAQDAAKLARIDNPSLKDFLAEYIEILQPAQAYIRDDSPEDLRFIREAAVKNGEEEKLAIEGHTVHFDNEKDQARDKEHTIILTDGESKLGSAIRTGDRAEKLPEIHRIIKGIMKGHPLYIRFFCLGPTNSEFSIPCVQLTDSAYVAHSEDLLYRQGFEEWVRQGKNAKYFRFVHSQGRTNEKKTCMDLQDRRVYIDLKDEIVFSTNTQYGGNTIGLKKLAMRLAIQRGAREGWLTEHMLVMAINGPNNRKTYFTGAFPSLCGKTSTAMLDGETIVGDDIAYLRNGGGEVRAVNVEKGIFGIIQGVNSKDDPIQWDALHSPNEIIFSNVLVTPEKNVHWIDKNAPMPEKGYNHAGDWFPGKKDAAGNEIPPSHPNARFTISLATLRNLDKAANDPAGVPVGGVVYGGRDADTSVPVEESFNWVHGIVTKGAALESETTAATLGKSGVRKFNPMSNLDFLSVSIGDYVKANLDFGKKLKKAPAIFSVNYFLRDGKNVFLNQKNDKKVWYKWMELRVNGDVDAIRTPCGFIPKYEDLKPIFKNVLDFDYTAEAYREQFKVRIPENLDKIGRIEKIYRETVPDAPREIYSELSAQRDRLSALRAEKGDYVYPEQL